MTKEELKQEAEEYLKNLDECKTKDMMRNAYLASAEPREKQIQIDAEHIIDLQKQNGELTDKVNELEVRCNELFLQTCEQAEKVKELEAQIEQMKCCYNCKHSRTEYEHCKTDKHEKWEIKEK